MQFKHLCLPSDMALSAAYILLVFCLHFFSQNANPFISPHLPLYSVFMSVSLRRKRLFLENCPVSHISFPKVAAGRNRSEGGKPARPAHWQKCEFISLAGSLKQENKSFFFSPLKSAGNGAPSPMHFPVNPSECVHWHLTCVPWN